MAAGSEYPRELREATSPPAWSRDVVRHADFPAYFRVLVMDMIIHRHGYLQGMYRRPERTHKHRALSGSAG